MMQPLNVSIGSRFLTNSSFASSPHDGHGDEDDDHDDHDDHKEEDLKLPEVRIRRMQLRGGIVCLPVFMSDPLTCQLQTPDKDDDEKNETTEKDPTRSIFNRYADQVCYLP